ncbi:MAG: efflux transporter outer membrane subunit [Verrucomicrobiales bacterium]|jgi:multidrug efflux system outer membrane protein|nr:efflux transporter outer membrane subunit [Verrucomicrobiales bacterium]
MSKPTHAATDTRTRILDAAEALIAENGFRTVSLRQITGNAEANLAAVHYHFGSREGLIKEVLARVIHPINQQRLHLLDLAEARHHGPVPLEEILDALHRPVVAEMQHSPHRTPVYLRLAGRCLAEPAENFSGTLVDLFQEVIARFLAATKKSLPHLDETSVFWRMHFSIGTMIYALTHEDSLPLFSDGRIKSTDPEETLARLIEFTAGGLRASLSHSTAASSSKRAKKCAPAILSLIAMAALVSSCQSISPPDAKHYASIKAPARWVAGPTYRPDHFPDHDWITHFKSADLTDFVEKVKANNLDLKAAQSRIEIAQSNAAIVGADLYPQLSGGFSSQRSLQNFIGLPIPGTPPGSVLSSRNNRFGLSLDLSWELDLWGRIRAAKSAVVAEFEASQFDRATAELSLAGQAAKTWFALAEAKDQVALARSAIATFSDTETSIRERFQAGVDEPGQNLASQLLLAEADVANANDALATRQELVGRSARQLDILAGKYPAGAEGQSARLPELPGKVPTDLPATLLDRRPDLAASERRIAAADKRLLEAKRSLLPAISLTGSFGSASEDISDILSGDFSIWSVAGNLVQPILQGGKLRANISKKDSELQLAATEFEQTALTAFGEVENALAAEIFLSRRIDALAEASRLALAAYRRSLEEFSLGTGDILTVLTSQQRLFSSRSQWLGVKRMRLDNRVDLYLSLGGSFHPCEPPLEKSPAP